MHDPADIALVDTHPESYRGTHHVHPVVDEVVLGLFPLGGQEAGVVAIALILYIANSSASSVVSLRRMQ